jgi:hypothetical protein
MLSNSYGLSSHLIELREHFLPTSKIEELAKPDNFEQDLDARAYLVLAHSAFEQFFEDTASEFAGAAVERWMKGFSPTRQQIITLCCLAASQGDFSKLLFLDELPEQVGPELKKPNGKSGVGVNPRLKILESLQAGVKNFETLLEKNHGADIHYLRVIFTPIGIFIDPSPDEQTALSQIANARGTFAHRRIASKKGKFAYRPIAAEKALQNVETLLNFSSELESRLRKLLEPDYLKILEEAKSELVGKLIHAIANLSLQKSISKPTPSIATVHPPIKAKKIVVVKKRAK